MIYEVRVTSDDPSPERFRWEIFRASEGGVIARSPVSFRMENTAMEAGRRALAQFLHAMAAPKE